MGRVASGRPGDSGGTVKMRPVGSVRHGLLPLPLGTETVTVEVELLLEASVD